MEQERWLCIWMTYFLFFGCRASASREKIEYVEYFKCFKVILFPLNMYESLLRGALKWDLQDLLILTCPAWIQPQKSVIKIDFKKRT